MRCTDLRVDIEPIRFVADSDHFGTEFVEHRRRDVIARPMRTIDDDLQALEVELVGEGALAEFDVATGGVVEPERLAKVLRLHASDSLVHRTLDRMLDGVGQLGTRGGEELDAVVFERIVRCADDDACRESQRARQIRDRGRGQRPGEIHVDAGGGEPRLQRRFHQVARNARVLADQHRRRLAHAIRELRREDAPSGVAEPQNQLGRYRRFADTTTHAIRTKVFLAQIARHIFSASMVSRTSCTRTIAAPRATAANAAAILPAMRSPTSRPVSAPIVDLRDSPASTG